MTQNNKTPSVEDLIKSTHAQITASGTKEHDALVKTAQQLNKSQHKNPQTKNGVWNTRHIHSVINGNNVTAPQVTAKSERKLRLVQTGPTPSVQSLPKPPAPDTSDDL